MTPEKHMRVLRRMAEEATENREGWQDDDVPFQVAQDKAALSFVTRLIEATRATVDASKTLIDACETNNIAIYATTVDALYAAIAAQAAVLAEATPAANPTEATAP